MIPREVIPLAVQRHHLLRMFPVSSGEIRRSTLVWVGNLKPSPASADYTVGLEYRIPDRPSVYVVTPELETRKGRRAEHLYADGCLCLYHHPTREWRCSMRLATTVVPWAAEWLLHYEIWLATGSWFGGGIHPRLTA